MALLWFDCDTSLIVEVVDTKTLDAFRVEVAATEALGAVRHPSAHAAFRGVEYIEPRRL